MKVLIRLHGCAGSGWFAPLLFACNKVKFSHVTADIMMKHIMIKCFYQDIILSFVNSFLCLVQEFIFENDTSLDRPLRVHSIFYTPRKLCLWWGILFSRCPSVRPSVTFCFFNILKSLGWIFIKPCKHVHICKINN